MNASGGTSYSWSPSTGLSNANIANPTATPSSTTTYTVTVSNGTCSDTDQVTVTVNNTTVDANAGADGMACGKSYQLSANGSIGSGVWTSNPSAGVVFSNSNDPHSTVTVSNFGFYTFIWTLNGICGTDSDNVIVEFGDYPSPAIAGNDATVCGLTYTMQAQIPAIGTGTWGIDSGVTISNVNDPHATVTVNNYGSYVFTWITTNCSCPPNGDQVTITFENPNHANAGADVAICQGQSTQLNASGGISYSWSPASGLSNPNIANPTASPNNTTTYTVTVVNAQGCTDTDQVTITVADPVYGNAGGGNTICAGGSVQLWASGGTTYSWSPSNGLSNANISNPTASPSATTIYTVTITNAQGCSDTEQVTVTVNDPVYGSAGVNGGNNTICAGGSVQLWASGGTTYSWSPSNGLSNANISNPTASPSATTIYTVTITNAQGCSDTEQVTVTVNDPYMAVQV
ncbi:MAG: hypothetical protein IPL35_07915 [Sphingobacteriales bacterium]|nr:hypothetical protein [Sphingobacteriales bacterium]